MSGALIRTRPALMALGAVLLAACAGDRPAERNPTAGVDPAGSWTVGLHRAGPIVYGMRVGTLRTHLPGAEEVEGCGYVSPAGGPPGLAFMIENGIVMRVDVDSSGVRTDSGVEVGAHEGDVSRAYSDSLETLPHKYEPGSRYLIIVPRSAADSAYRIVFELDSSGRVVRYRAGLRPAVEYVERCG